MAYINSKKYGSAVQLYLKANGDISYSITYKDEDNKLKRIKIGDKSKGITEPYCNQKRNEVINSVRLGTDVPIKHKKKSGILFGEIAKKYLDDLKLHASENTIKDVESKYYKHLEEVFKDVPVDRIKSDDLVKLQKEKINILSATTTNYIVELVGTIINFGLKKDLCKIINPVIKVKRFKIDNNRERFLVQEELNKLYENLSDNELLKLFVKLSLTTGGRLETILHIQKKDIDLATNMITLCDLKNKDTYRSFLTDEVSKLISAKIDGLKPNDYLVSLNGEKITSRQIQSRLKPKLDKLFNADLDISDRKNRVVIHTLRHTFASHLAIRGTPIFTIQNLMNHKDIKQTMRYAKLAPDSGRNFVNDLYQ